MTAFQPGSPTRRTRAPILALVAAGLLLAGCRHDSEARLGIDEKTGAPDFDPNRLARPGELEKALATSSAEVAKRLHSFRLVQQAKWEVSALKPGAAPDGEADDQGAAAPAGKDAKSAKDAKDPKQAKDAKADEAAAHVVKDGLDEHWLLEVDAKGNSHTLQRNSHDYGIERHYVDGILYVQPLDSKTVRRTPERNEVSRRNDEIQGVMGSFLAVLGRFASRKDGGQGSFEGRPTRKVLLTLNPSPPSLREGDPTHLWRTSVRATALSGSFEIDEQTGMPVHAHLSATYETRRNPYPSGALTADTTGATPPQAPRGADDVITVHLEASAEADSIGSLPTIKAPADSIPAPMRTRPLLDRQALLEGLVAAPINSRPSGP